MSHVKSNEQLDAIETFLNIKDIPHTINVDVEHHVIQLGYYNVKKRENKLVAINMSSYKIIRIEDEIIVAGFESAYNNAKAIMDEHNFRYG